MISQTVVLLSSETESTDWATDTDTQALRHPLPLTVGVHMNPSAIEQKENTPNDKAIYLSGNGLYTILLLPCY